MNDISRYFIYHHYDRDDIVDEYVLYMLRSLKDYGGIHLVTNSALPEKETQKVAPFVDGVTLRQNRGYDFAGWKQALLERGREFFSAFDELILVNSTVYGPLFDLSEMFDEMAGKDCDFWAPTWHSGLHGIPPHIQPYFLVTRRRLHQSDIFWNFWKSIREDYADLWDVIWDGEIRLHEEWSGHGFRSAAYVDLPDKRELRPIGYYEPLTIHGADLMVARYRLPFLKMKAFYKLEERPFSLTRHIFSALDEAKSIYPRELILRHQRRVAPLSWHKNLPGTLMPLLEEGVVHPRPDGGPIGVFGHFFYPDLFEFAVEYLKNIPYEFDMFLTTDKEEKAAAIRDITASSDLKLHKLKINLVGNRGREIGPWLIEFRDEHLKYDIALNIHLKKHSKSSEVLGVKWNRYMYECVLRSPSYVSGVIRAFDTQPDLGIAFPSYPPIYTMAFPRGYYGSPEDLDHRKKILEQLGICPPEESCQPVFSAGGMNWYRPRALRRLLEWNLSYEDFPPEPLAPAGTMAHGLERVIPYVAQAEGFSFRLLMPPSELETAYQMFEDRIMSVFDEKPYVEAIHEKDKLIAGQQELIENQKKIIERLKRRRVNMFKWPRFRGSRYLSRNSP